MKIKISNKHILRIPLIEEDRMGYLLCMMRATLNDIFHDPQMRINRRMLLKNKAYAIGLIASSPGNTFICR